MVSIASTSTSVSTAAANNAASAARLASGKKITQASDDVASLAIGTALNTQVTALRSALGNASAGASLLQVAGGSLDQQLNILERQKALATQASSGQLSTTDRSALNQEFQGLSDQLNQLASGTNFNGVSLLDGSTAQAGGSLNFAVGTSDTDTISISLDSTSTSTLFNNQPVDISTQASAQVAAATIDNAIAAITSAQAGVGALQSSFDTASNDLTSALQAQSSAGSALLDTDIGAESTNFAATKVQAQASIAVQAQANKLNSGLLTLVQ